MRRRAAVLARVACAAATAMCTAGAAPLSAQTVVRDASDSVAVRQPPRALAELLADASRRNVLPADLHAYKARVETEISTLLRREEGTEAVAALEGVASDLRWTRSGQYEQRVIGYRAQQMGFTFSMLSVLRTGWLNPVLYGNRLRIRTDASRRTAPARSDGSDTLPAVHPLAVDRDRYYRYSGGDTVVTMQVGARRIPIVHVRVQPRADVDGRVLLFDGELDLDASRGALVRLRGHFVRVNTRERGMLARLIEPVAFIEYENGERGEQYWLPSRQRIELQVASPFTGEGRAVIRIVSRFTDVMVNDTVLSAATLAAADSLRAFAPRRLTFAHSDSMSRYRDWRTALGDISTGMHADDFEAIAPDRWRPTGAPRLDVTAPRGADVFHFNRVEGVYTGAGVRIALRDLAPGVTIRANAGWAWNERTARGRVAVERVRGEWTVEARGGRSLDNTNDFRVPFDSGATFGALFGSSDPYDYVDRRSATLAVVRRYKGRTIVARLEGGVGDDRYRAATYIRSPFGGDAFRPNRGVDEGGYVRTAALVEWHPDVSAEFMRPGLSTRLSYERGDGTIDWQRAEVRLTGRRPFGPFIAAARGDAGVVLGGRIPPQQLFELGRQQSLPGYEDKEFAGSRAAVLRAQLLYTSPFLRQPLRVTRRLVLPAIAPGASIGLQSGWTELPSAASRAAVLRLGTVRDSITGALVPVSRATEGARASVSAGLRFFGGSLFTGVVRPVDQAAPWKLLVTFGQQW